jgi:acetyltransferase-like isoleucine patch superfamily enzyme
MLNRLARAAKDTLPNNINRLGTLIYRLKAMLYYRWTFGSIGAGSYLRTPCYLANTQFIHIGRNSFVAKGARLEAVRSSPIRRPELLIGDHVNIEQNVHIICHHRVVIGSNVSIAPMCSIMDTTHPFDGVGEAKVGQLLQDDDAVVEIGDGTWIGIGAVILPNVRIGERCVIGANSVVTRDIPARSVAVGAPARVIRIIR